MPSDLKQYFIFLAAFIIVFGLFSLITQLVRMKKPRYMNPIMLVSLFVILFALAEVPVILFGRPTQCLPLLFLFSGTGLLATGLYNRRLYKKCCREIIGSYVFRSQAKGDTQRPIFRYTFDGEDYEAISQQAVSKNRFAYGKTYRIYIAPDRPQVFVIYPKLLKGNTDILVFGGILFALGIVITVLTALGVL